MDRCPTCYTDLRGSMIPGSDPPKFYSRIVGVEIPGIYDGTLFWQCPYCDARFHRFVEGTDLWRKAEPYVRKIDDYAVRLEIQERLARRALGEVVLEDGSTLYNVHSDLDCAGRYCCIHNPSSHPLSSADRTWIDGQIWRVCEHAKIHPDYDDVAYKIMRDGEVEIQHTCCPENCCTMPEDFVVRGGRFVH